MQTRQLILVSPSINYSKNGALSCIKNTEEQLLSNCSKSQAKN